MIQVLVGAIASGKSSYSSHMAKRGLIIMNDDAVVLAVHSGVYGLYDKKLKPLYKSIENTIVCHAVAMGRDVVVDRGTNNSKASRRRFIGLAHSLDVEVEAVVFPFDGWELHAQRRFVSDNRGLALEYWQEVAKAHSAKFEWPDVVEGFDKVTVLSLDELQGKYLQLRG